MSRWSTFLWMVAVGAVFCLIDFSASSVRSLFSAVVFGGGALAAHWLANRGKK